MKASTERLLLAGILVSGLVAFWAHSAGASSSAPDAEVPASFYPLLTPLERQFVWNETQNNTGPMMASKTSIYASTVLFDGSLLSPPALAALATEAAKKVLQ
jgi:hypothetical protein